MDGDDKERLKDKENDKLSVKNRDDGKGSRDHGCESSAMEHKQNYEVASGGPQQSTTELQQRMQKMKEERLKEKSEGVSEVLSWVSKSRKLEEKRNAEKKKALRKSKVFEEQDNNVLGESEDEEPIKHTASDLAGVKVLHGIDKVIEGGAVVLTLKDQNILADGDINEEVDMLENVEIGEQKQRDEAYKAAKKKPGTYDDKFNDEAGDEKKMLPQYDDPMENEGVTLDASGSFTGAAGKKLEELRKRIQGVSTKSVFEDLTSSAKISSDYYTQDEMLQFKKPKKKKSLRKKDKLDLDSLEAEAISAGLGVGDLGSRKDGKRQIAKEEEQRSEAQMRSDAYQSAYAKAEEASKALRQELPSTTQVDEDETVFGDEDDDIYKAFEKSRRLALKKQGDGAISGLQAVASLALTAGNRSEETQNPSSGDTQENKVVFTEMEEFVGGLQLNNDDTHKPKSEDIYMDEDETLNSFDQETKDEPAGWTEVNDISNDELPTHEETETVPDETLHEVAVGKGLSGALKLLKERGTLKETIEWGGRNMDKKKSKLVGIHENDGPKEIHIERLDEFGRVMTPKEAYRLLSHNFHGKGPGKTKLEKRQKQYQEEQKLKQMKNSDTPSQSVEKMRAAQAYTGKPYLVLTGNVKSGQNGDPRSGFSTVEDLPGGLTPMLGDRKVEHFLGIKRKAEPSNMGPPKKQKPN
ncbi:Sart-1 family protein dot2 [Thalictrum thalictroides]|uniref:Sart-1 family protein dot2 n=1 Tax=Thalictrum thalictroides TaxID=46969 RepID=A0A7J6VD43_THATH|nr:Sart-1 family protein dot2 [Thalictrum thalictroides]